jgi:RNA polymerase sigma-70 factor (ECF subfamily)
MNADQQLWQKLREGDKKALSDIYQAQVDALFRYGCQFTHDQSLVEDMIQDLFIELWKNHATLGATDAIRQYLLVALRRKIIRQLQQFSQRQEKAAQHWTAAVDTEAADQKLIANETTSEQQERASKALAQLSDRQREVLYLKYFEGFNYKEIADLLQLNHQSVRNTATAGLKALRKLVISWWGLLLWLIELSS